MSASELHDWHLLTPIAPRLKSHVDVYRHVYAGQSWYIFHDRVGDRYFRLNSSAAQVLSSLDGVHSIEEIVKPHPGIDGAEAISAEDVSAFIGQLKALDLLDTGAPPVMAEFDKKREAELAKKSWRKTLGNPLFLRIPLFDPYPLIVKIYPWVSWLFGRWGFLTWSFLVIIGAIIGLMNWNALTDNITDRLFSAENIALTWCLYPIIKVIHELAHGLALYTVGGQVRRTGIMLVAFMPIPYVDASESNILERKTDRMFVAGAGILAEMLLGSIALIGWISAEPGLFRSICSTTVMISGFSTVLFNGNPLQRYDGYYILSDLIEVPSLGTRSTLYMSYLSRRFFLREKDAPKPNLSRYERNWFIAYGPASFIYRIGLMLSISMYVAETYPFFGGLLGAWTAFTVLVPLIKGIRNSIQRGQEGKRLSRAATIAAVLVPMGLILFFLPLPFGVVAQGYTDVPEDSIVRLSVSGTIAELLVEPGALVQPGQPILRLSSLPLHTELQRQTARVAEMEATYAHDFNEDQVKGAIAEQKLQQARQELQSKQKDVRDLIVRSPAAGKVLFHDEKDMLGRYVTKGEKVARIWAPNNAIIRTFVDMTDIDLIRSRVDDVSVRLGYAPLESRAAKILRIQPQPSDTLRSPVMSLAGGGPFAVQSGEDGQLHLNTPAFQIEVAVQHPENVMFLGGRSFIRFDLGFEPLGFQLIRKIRLTFLRRLNV